ncbi:MAG: TonB-dependent receptor [Pseudomonadota bacterium]
MRKTWLTTSALVTCFALGAIPAFAQDSAAEEANGGTSAALDTIVVSASRRGDVSIQDLPTSIIAVGESTFEEVSAEGFNDYVKFVPGLTALSSGPGQTQFVIRGVNTGRIAHDNPEAQAAVGIYINEVPISTTGFNPDLNLFDLDRVEVLRGPQGTLFGASAMSGAIRLITNQPDPSGFEAKTQTTVSNTDQGGFNYGLKGMVNVPLVGDRLALRVVGYYNDFSGWIDNVQNGDNDYNDEESYGARAAVAWYGDNVTLNGSIIYQNLETGGRPDEYVPGSVEEFYSAFDGSPTIDFSDVVPPTDEYQTFKFVDDTFTDEFVVGNLTATFDFDFAELVSSSSYTYRDFGNTLDDTSRGRILAGVFPVIANAIETPFVGPVPFTNDVTVEAFTQEARLQSKGGEWFDWMFGIFYDTQDREFVQTDTLVGAGLPLGFNESTIENSLFDGRRDLQTKQFAAFGEVNIYLTEKLEFVTGRRWFDWSLDIDTIQRGGVIDAATAGVVQIERADTDGFTPKFQLNYKATDDMLFYANASKGFRLGRSNSVIPVTCNADLAAAGFPDNAPTTVNPDELWNYELGAKTDLANGRLRANAALYRIEWSGLPSQFRLNCGFSFEANAGEVETNGVELDLVGQLTDNLRLSFGLAYADSELTDVGGAFPETFLGSTPPYVPDLTISGGAKYDFELLNSLASVRADVRHVSSSFSEFDQNPAAIKLPSYTTVDLAANMDYDTFGLSLFVRNVSDERVVTNVDPERNLPPQFSVDRPRTYGLTLRKSF